MTNAVAAKRSLDAMRNAFGKHTDTGRLDSGEMLTFLMDAVRAEFGQMKRDEFERRHLDD